MNKKIVVIIIIILFICGISIYSYNSYFKNTMEVSGTYFKIPDGYNYSTENKYTILTNDSNILYINSYNTTDIVNLTGSYKQHNDKYDVPINITNKYINDILVYKSSMKTNSSIIHYWFVHNNKTFQIYTWTADSNTEKIMDKLVSSIHDPIF